MATVLWLAALLALQIRHPLPLPDPAADAVRLEVRMTTSARFASVLVDERVFGVADGRRVSGPADLRTEVRENLLALSNNREGQPATVAYRVVLTRLAAGTSVRFTLDVQAPRIASVEIVNLNDESQPRIVDRFEGAAGTTVASSGDQLRAGVPLRDAQARPDRLVLGHYYPWYERPTWSDPQMLDQPLRAYSTDDRVDVARVLGEAREAGLDGVIVSWQGRDTGDGWNHRRMQLVLQGCQQAGLRASVHLETLAANRAKIEGAPTEVDVVVEWLIDIHDLLAVHPAYLRLQGRPVVFVYAWEFGGRDTWRVALERVRASGRELAILAETTDPTAMAGADGHYTYAATLFASDIDRFTRTLAVSGRTWHLLGAGYGSRRVAMATVSPGYDETRLNNRPLDRVVDRASGAFYDAQWAAALASGADWVLITSFNEWWENTQIESSQRFGERYGWRTKFWATAFKSAPKGQVLESAGR